MGAKLADRVSSINEVVVSGNSVIGALRVSLGIDTAELSAGLKKAQSGIAGFGKAAAVGFAAVAAAAVAAGGALAVMGKKAIDGADNLSKTAQKAGVTTEALSRLKYAADFSDVSLETLSGGLQKLSKNMADVASGKGGSVATAFSALGISIKDTSGALRNSDEVFADIADRFSRIESGSTKTALAMQLFGKSGAELIPLLNSGRDGLRQMAEESDRLGLTISTETGQAAEEFNDRLTKISLTLQGVANRIAEAALPKLNALAKFVDGLSPEIVSWGTALLGAAGAITAIGIAASAAAPALGLLAGTLGVIATSMGAIAAIPGGLALLTGGAYFASTGQVGAGEDALVRTMRERWEATKALVSELKNLKTQSADSLYEGFAFGKDGKIDIASGDSFKVPPFEDTGAAEALAARLEALRQSLMNEEQLEIDSHAKRLEEIQKFFEDGAILRGEYDTMLEAAQQQHADRMTEIAKRQIDEEARLRGQLVGNVAGIFGSLSNLAETFGDKGLAASKAFGVAEAIINTAQGITKALAQGGALGFTGAAAVAAAGAAQIATILSTNKGGSSRPSVGGSGAASTAAVPAPQRSGLTIDLSGLSPTDLFSGAQVAGILDGLKEYLGTQGQELAINYKGA